MYDYSTCEYPPSHIQIDQQLPTYNSTLNHTLISRNFARRHRENMFWDPESQQWLKTY